jgi:hypothetical protein
MAAALALPTRSLFNMMLEEKYDHFPLGHLSPRAEARRRMAQANVMLMLTDISG